MKVKINETEKVVELEIIDDNGINWVSDLIGNTGATSDGQFAWNDEDEIYIADQDTVEWWQEYISALETNERAVNELAYQFDITSSDVKEAMQFLVGDVEFNDIPGREKATLAELSEMSAAEIEAIANPTRIITPHKGGRTKQVRARITPDDLAKLDEICSAAGISRADWISRKINQA